MERDTETTDVLERRGWTVLRIWEHEDPAVGLERIRAVLRDQAVRDEHS
jgi:DNA mismatch endonuclease (patch repair protein)